MFRVFFYDCNVNQKITELPPYGLTYERRLNDSGSMTLKARLHNGATRLAVAPLMAYNGNFVKAYVDLDGVIVWSGLAWTSQYQLSAGELTIAGKEFPAWFDQRLQASDYSTAWLPSVDPAAMMLQAMHDAQTAATDLTGAPLPGQNLGLQFTGGTSSLPAVHPGYRISQHTTVATIINDVITMSEPGVAALEYTSDSVWGEDGFPQDFIHIWSPRAGRQGVINDAVIDLDAAIDYTWQFDPTQSGYRVVATGVGSGATLPIAEAFSTDPVGVLGSGPLTEKALTFNSVAEGSMMGPLAAGGAVQYGRPVQTPTVTLPLFDGAGLYAPSYYSLGDDVLVRSNPCDLFPQGLDTYRRIVGDQVTVNSEGVSTVQLTLNDALDF